MLNCLTMKAQPAPLVCPWDIPQNPLCVKEGSVPQFGFVLLPAKFGVDDKIFMNSLLKTQFYYNIANWIFLTYVDLQIQSYKVVKAALLWLRSEVY
jgi:hypothetical protein